MQKSMILDQQKTERTPHRKVRRGVVVSNKMQKTVVVNVSRTIRDPKYQKVVERSKKYYAHDEDNTAKIGDEVVIVETRPLSKLKRWRVVEVKHTSAPHAGE